MANDKLLEQAMSVIGKTISDAFHAHLCHQRRTLGDPAALEWLRQTYGARFILNTILDREVEHDASSKPEDRRDDSD